MPPATWNELVGKTVLVGVTYVDADDEPTERVQYCGLVLHADDEGVQLRRSDTLESQWLPPRLESYVEAESGEYRLRSTGEVIVDPDYHSTWTVRTREPE